MSNISNPDGTFGGRLDNAKNYAEVWQIVKDSVQFAQGKRRDAMMLFLDDLPLQLGAYYPVGTNNIVLNRALVEIVEASMSDKPTFSAYFLYAKGVYLIPIVQPTFRK